MNAPPVAAAGQPSQEVSLSSIVTISFSTDARRAPLNSRAIGSSLGGAC